MRWAASAKVFRVPSGFVFTFQNASYSPHFILHCESPCTQWGMSSKVLSTRALESSLWGPQTFHLAGQLKLLKPERDLASTLRACRDVTTNSKLPEGLPFRGSELNFS